MSNKRPRDQASIASLKAILGDLPTETIENLLHRSNNDVEVAVNMYFTEPQQAPTQSSSVTSSGAAMAPVNQANLRYYIGEMVITGECLLVTAI